MFLMDDLWYYYGSEVIDFEQKLNKWEILNLLI